MKYDIAEGDAYPLGATVTDDGVNFAIFSAHAEKVELCLFDRFGQLETTRIALPGYTDQIWHVFVRGLTVGSLYGYRVYGPYEPANGHRFNHHKLLIDPYAKKLDGVFHWSDYLFGYQIDHPQQDLIIDTHDNSRYIPKCVVVDNNIFCQTETVSKPSVPWEDTIIYETHVRGFTQLNLKVPANERGTFAGLANPDTLNYLSELGITAVELLPVHQFVDEKFLVNQGLSNYWGYNTLNFFMPHQQYLCSGEPVEFLHMVNQIHAAGMEVILDVVYNHTCEGNQLGPTLSFRGIDNLSYYGLEAHDARYYVNDTGCGNTINIKHPRVLQMVMDSLRFWADEMQVDGFRFDLASVLGRESYGFDTGSGFFDAIRQDPILNRCKLIAEPWDIGPGGYQLGNYPSGWSEWNDRYRDTVRKFWRGDGSTLPEFARRIHGSSDLFEHSGRGPSSSLNLVTSHDGFTLQDVVSYKNRHNEANKENNNDGHHSNYSDNYGVEGPTEIPDVIEIRNRQKRNYIATLMLSQGTPMLLAGDELGRTQRGNNNAYCQDNEINWLDWQNILDSDKSLQEFTRHVIKLRRQHPLLRAKKYIHKPEELSSNSRSCVSWLNIDGELMKDNQWGEPENLAVVWVLENDSLPENTSERAAILILFNSSKRDQKFTLPKKSQVINWTCLLDTSFSNGIPTINNIPPSETTVLKEKSLQMFVAYFED